MQPEKHCLDQIQNVHLSAIIYFHMICPIFDKQETVLDGQNITKQNYFHMLDIW